MQNRSLREELATLKSQLAAAPEVPVVDDPPPKYEPEDSVALEARRAHRQNVASSCNSDYFLKNDDADADSLERAAMTHSVSVNKLFSIASQYNDRFPLQLIQTVEAESNCLRRELLRSRCQRKIRHKLDKEEEEDKQVLENNTFND